MRRPFSFAALSVLLRPAQQRPQRRLFPLFCACGAASLASRAGPARWRFPRALPSLPSASCAGGAPASPPSAPREERQDSAVGPQPQEAVPPRAEPRHAKVPAVRWRPSDVPTRRRPPRRCDDPASAWPQRRHPPVRAAPDGDAGDAGVVRHRLRRSEPLRPVVPPRSPLPELRPRRVRALASGGGAFGGRLSASAALLPER